MRDPESGDMTMSDNSLYMEDDTTVTDVLTFVRQRVESPTVFDGVIIYNFRNQSLNANALFDWLEGAEPGVYVVPYQISGVWAFMAEVLPDALQYAEILAYRQSDDAYVSYENWGGSLDRCEFADTAGVVDEIEEIRAVVNEEIHDAV